jgi:hypothetical protein
MFHITGWGSAAVWPGSGGNNQTELGTTVTNPGYRYGYIDANVLRPVIHRRFYFKKDPVILLQGQPDTYAQNVHIWMNLICRSRQKLLLVAPGA